MLLFQPPPETQYDLRFAVAGIPVRVHPLFWVMTLLFGASSGNITLLLIWVGVVFVSILVHELGHAFAMRWFGLPSHIVLHISGGLTVPESVSWGRSVANVSLHANQEILVSLSGPGAGFLLALLVMVGVVASGGSIGVIALFGIFPFPTAVMPIAGNIINSIVATLLWVNIFWGLINLMPVFPLDGGNVTRRLMVKANPWDGLRKSLWISVIAGGAVAATGLLLLGSIYVALLFGLLAFQSCQSLQGRSGIGY